MCTYMESSSATTLSFHGPYEYTPRSLVNPFPHCRAQLAASSESYDVIVGDLCDPVEDGPCYTLYTQAFYADVLKQRLAPGGIFVTQAGPAGILSAREVYSPIFNTLRQVFKCE